MLLFVFYSYAAEECPQLKNPANGTVTYDERVYPNEAVYECDNGFELRGDATRKCEIDGEWAGDAPECQPASKREDIERELRWNIHLVYSGTPDLRTPL